MNLVIFDAVDADRLKSSQADMKRDLGGYNSALADAVENLGSEVQAGGGGGD